MPTRGRGGGIGGGGFDKSTTTFVAPVNKTRRHSSNCHYDSLIKISSLPRVVTRGSMATLTLARMRCRSPSKKWSAVRTLS